VTRPVAVDLFAGVGGMSLGFEQAGFDVVCAVESDRAHAAAHRFNFPLCEVLQVDVRSLTGVGLREAVRAGLRRHGRSATDKVDVVFGGPPCQGFSLGGLRDPDDPRNRLVEEFARLVLALRPRVWVLENVPTMAARSLPGDTSGTVVDWLADRTRSAGYEIPDAAVLNANRYRIPQDRRRLLVVGARGRLKVDLPDALTAGRARVPGRDLRLGELGHPDTSSELPACPTVADALDDLPNLDAYDELWRSDSVVLRDADRERIRSASRYARVLAGELDDEADLARPRRRSPSVLSASMRTFHSDDVLARFAGTLPGEREKVSRFLRLHPDGTAPTLRAGTAPDRGSYSAPKPIHHVHDRVITVREAARLHGFPDWFRPTAAKWHGFRQVGNAVPPPLARAIAREIVQALGADVAKPERRLSLGSRELLHVAAGGGRAAAKRLLVARQSRDAAKAA
jgi:DNA (cytosine-5)-methyltransferase 1